MNLNWFFSLNPDSFLKRKLFSKHFPPSSSYGRMAVRDRFADLRERIKTDSPVIVDGGANTGSTIDMFLKQYRSPFVHAFEPIPSLAEALRTRFELYENIVVYDKALGSKSENVSFNVVNNLVSSSILNPSEICRGYHGSNVDIKEVLYVQQVRLDEIMDQEIDILKLDLQGYELQALKGSEKLLPKVKTITTEVEFVALYEEQPLLGDLDVYLRGSGFRLLNLYELYTHPDGQLTAGDAVYLNTRYFTK